MPAFLTREFFDTLIIVIVIIGTALAAVRIYRDFTRPLPRIPLEDMTPDNLILSSPVSESPIVSDEDPTPTSGSR